jgi:hypothetical protein
MEHYELIRWYYEYLIYPLTPHFLKSMIGKYDFTEKQLETLDRKTIFFKFVIRDIIFFWENC